MSKLCLGGEACEPDCEVHPTSDAMKLDELEQQLDEALAESDELITRHWGKPEKDRDVEDEVRIAIALARKGLSHERAMRKAVKFLRDDDIDGALTVLNAALEDHK